MGLSVGELFVQLGVKADTFTVKDFAQAMGNLPLSVGAALTALTGMDLGFIAMTGHTLDMANNLNIFRSETGLSTDQLQRWQNAAKQAGISGDAVTQSILGISNAVVQIKRFGAAGPAVAFGRLGISDWANKTPFELLVELRTKYKNMNPNEFRAYTQQLGVSPEMTRLFELPAAKFEGMMKAGPALDNSDLRAMAEFQAELARFTITVDREFAPVLRELTPVMGELAKTMGVFVQAFGGLAVAGIKTTNEIVNRPKEYGADLKNVATFLIGQMMETMQDMASGKSVAVNVTQHITGVTTDQDAHRTGAEHLKRELTHTAKHLGASGGW